MPWTEVKPFDNAQKTAHLTAFVTVNKPGRFAQRILIAVTEAPAWWKKGAAVTVLAGTGTDAGKLRIVPKGPHTVGAGGGRGAMHPRLAIPLLSHVTLPKGLSRRGVEHDYGDDWIELDLPAQLVGRVGSAEQPSVGQRPNGQAFQTAATRNANRRGAVHP